MQAKLAQHEIDAADWRDTCVSYWQEFNNLPMPADHGPLSAKIRVAGRWIGGFNLSAGSYSIPVPAGASPRITAVVTAEPAAHYQILSQATSVPGQAIVRVTKDDFFGPLVKNYVFNLMPDTTLKSLTVNGTPLASFQPGVLHYNAVLPAGTTTVAQVGAAAGDPAATVSIGQASSPTGQATVTVTNGGASSVYTVDLNTALTGSDEFDSAQLGSQWYWVRSLDAIHLATARLLGSELTALLTYDDRLAKAAADAGMPVLAPQIPERA